MFEKLKVILIAVWAHLSGLWWDVVWWHRSCYLCMHICLYTGHVQY